MRGSIMRGMNQDEVAELAPYLLVEPFVADKDVLDVDAAAPRGADRLALAGGARVAPLGATAQRLGGIAGASADVVLWFGRTPWPADAAARAGLVRELRRIVRPDGFVVVRVDIAAPQRLVDADPAGVRPDVVLDDLRHAFAHVDVVAQVPFYGFSFAVLGVVDVAVNEDLVSSDVEPSHRLAFCRPNADGPAPYTLTESLLVPVASAIPSKPEPAPGPDPKLAARVDELARDRDQLRERVMQLEDQRERADLALASLRRDADRYLRQVSDLQAEVEVAGIEREQTERRARAAEQDLQTLRTMARQEDTGVRQRLLDADRRAGA